MQSTLFIAVFFNSEIQTTRPSVEYKNILLFEGRKTNSLTSRRRRCSGMTWRLTIPSCGTCWSLCWMLSQLRLSSSCGRRAERFTFVRGSRAAGNISLYTLHRLFNVASLRFFLWVLNKTHPILIWCNENHLTGLQTSGMLDSLIWQFYFNTRNTSFKTLLLSRLFCFSSVSLLISLSVCREVILPPFKSLFNAGVMFMYDDMGLVRNHHLSRWLGGHNYDHHFCVKHMNFLRRRFVPSLVLLSCSHRVSLVSCSWDFKRG